MAAQIKGKIYKIKKKQDKNERRQMTVLGNVPTYIVEVILEFCAFVSYNL